MRSRVRKKYSHFPCVHRYDNLFYVGGEEARSWHCQTGCNLRGINRVDYSSSALVLYLEECENCKHFKPKINGDYISKKKFYRICDREYRKWRKEQENNRIWAK